MSHLWHPLGSAGDMLLSHLWLLKGISIHLRLLSMGVRRHPTKFIWEHGSCGVCRQSPADLVLYHIARLVSSIANACACRIWVLPDMGFQR